MKILQVSNYAPHLLGGLEAVVFNLSKELSSKGNKVTVISSTNSAKYTKVPLENFLLYEIPSFILNYRAIIPRRFHLIKDIIMENDVIHIHSPDMSFSLIVGYLSKLLKKPIVISVLNYLDTLKHPSLFTKVLAFPLEMAVGTLAKSSDVVHVLNNRDYVKLSMFNKNVIYVPNGIPKKYFLEHYDSKMFLNKFDIADRRVILYVGRLHPLKGPQILIKAMKSLVKYDKSFLAVLVGPGHAYKNNLEMLIRELKLEKNVLITGILNEEEKISAYDSAEVLVIPSCYDHVEAFSLVASEAWARGKPVVGSKIGALKERIKPGINGYLFEPNNPNDLSEKILKAISFKLDKIPPDVCAWKDVATQYESVYKSILR